MIDQRIKEDYNYLKNENGDFNDDTSSESSDEEESDEEKWLIFVIIYIYK